MPQMKASVALWSWMTLWALSHMDSSILVKYFIIYISNLSNFAFCHFLEYMCTFLPYLLSFNELYNINMQFLEC